MGQGQHRVIIYVNVVELESPMLHAKFQDHRTSGSLRFSPYMDMAAIFVMCLFIQAFVPLPRDALHEILL